MRKKVAMLGVLLALALIFSYIESLVPFYFGVPGMKLGLTNVVILLCLYLFGWKEALLISVMRVLLAGFMFGNAFSIAYSMAGGLLSLLVMYLLHRFSKLAIFSVSVAGGVSHNLGQILLACWLVQNYNVMYYFPLLVIAGVITGLLIGLLSSEVYVRIRNLYKEETR